MAKIVDVELSPEGRWIVAACAKMFVTKKEAKAWNADQRPPPLAQNDILYVQSCKL